MTNEPLLQLPVLSPDPARTERVRARCHKALNRRKWLISLLKWDASSLVRRDKLPVCDTRWPFFSR